MLERFLCNAYCMVFCFRKDHRAVNDFWVSPLLFHPNFEFFWEIRSQQLHNTRGVASEDVKEGVQSPSLHLGQCE